MNTASQDKAVGEETPEVRKQAAQINLLKRELQELAHAVSHDLRAPLRSLSGFAGLILEEMPAEVNPDLREYARHIREGSGYASTLLDALLEYSRVETHGWPFETVSLASLVEAAWLDVRPERAGLEVEFRCPKSLGHMVGDGKQLTRVFELILRNCISYRNPTRPLQVAVKVAHQQGKYVIEVADNGRGVEAENRLDVFSLFKRFTERDSPPGLGAGLAIVRRITERHRMDIWLEEVSDNGGLCVCLGLPQDAGVYTPPPALSSS